MKKNYLKRLAALAALPMLFCVCGAFGQEAILGKDAPADFVWKAPNNTEMSYLPISMDGKSYTLYARAGEFFAPVHITPSRTLNSRYPAPIAQTMDFFTRHEEGGKAFFTPALSVKTGMAKDAVVAVFSSKSGSLNSACVDIGIESMPLASFSVVNMSPQKMAFSLDKSKFVLKPFGVRTESYTSVSTEIKGATLRIYDLKSGPQPKLLLSKTYSFWTDRRMIVFLFGYGSERVEEDFSDNNVPTTILYDKGPR